MVVSVILFPLGVFLTLLDFVVYLVSFQWVSLLPKLFAGTPLRTTAVDGEESHRVRTGYSPSTLLVSMYPGEVFTVHDLMEKVFDKYGDRKCLGTREFVGMRTPKIKEFGSTSWLTYTEMRKTSGKFGAALRGAGLVETPAVATIEALTTPCTLAIYENTCPEWFMAAIGSFSQGISITTIYGTLGMDAVIDAIQEGTISAILCNRMSVADIVSKLPSMKSLKTIIYTDDLVAPGDKSAVLPSPNGVSVISFAAFVASGDTVKYPANPPKPSATAVTMYTSGSTGKPKGVIITHKNILATVSALRIDLALNEEDVYLAYLPLAHIMEFTAEFTCAATGTAIAYADPRTLTKTGAYPTGALEEFRPTCMAGVPKIWDIIKKGIQAKVAGSSPVVQFLFQTAFAARSFAIRHGYDTPLFKAMIFKKMAAATGGNLRMAISGGGPLNAEVQVFIRTCVGAAISQGYGLTETCASLTLQDMYDDERPGIAGVLTAASEAKLVSCEVNDKAGLPYRHTDRKDADGNDVLGRGEVWVRGTSLGIGYYKMPEKTAEVFLPGGWFCTGDIGQFVPDGSLQIVDRLKNLIKLKGGEYIAIEQMEMVYGNSNFVDAPDGGIACFGDGEMDRPIAMMQLNKPAAMAWAKANGVAGDFDTIRKDKGLQDSVFKELIGLHKKSGLSGLEKIVALAILEEPWTPENGCLTATNKLQRKSIQKMFEKEFNEIRNKAIF